MKDTHESHHIHEHGEHCCCGHEHHHEHGEHCSCGHEHHHEHEEHCSCGHEHHHEHETHMHRTHVYILENLGCPHCAAKMEEKISMLPGISDVTITYTTKKLRFAADHPETYLPEIQAICSSIESQVKVIVPEPTHSIHTHHQHASDSHAEDHKKKQRKELIEILIGTAIFFLGLILMKTNCNEAIYAAVFVCGYLLLGHGIILEAIRNIGHGQIFDENFLMSLATIGAFCIREYPEALGIMLFYRIGELFEHLAVERSRIQIMDALDLRPEVVNRINHMHGDELEVIPSDQAKPGDFLLVRPGDRIPLDGKVAEGNSSIDTSPITGEPIPVAVYPGDSLISGCINTSGQLKMLVEKPLSESMVTRILNSVENAAASKPQIDRFITRFARIYTPFVVTAALLTAVLPPIFTGNWNYWIYTAISFLVMSCPCALVLSVPLAFFSGIGAGSKRKILFKGGASIEALTKINAVVMDKTGTITNGNFLVQNVVSVSQFSSDELLSIGASCEQHSTHPIASSITAAAQEKNLPIQPVLSMEEIAGQGIIASLPLGSVLCGNRKLMNEHQINLSAIETAAYGAEVFLAVNGTLAGYLLISDSIKADAHSAIQKLKSQGLHTAMLTGDSSDSAETVAKETGIHECFSRLLPDEKLTILQNIRKEHGAVMFVGDGINDAPVLAGADVGAAMGSGADAAIEAADVVFMSSTVESIADAIQIARNTYQIAMQNVIFALAVKALVMILGLCGFANMWMAVFADTGVAMLCVLNSIRALYKK